MYIESNEKLLDHLYKVDFNKMLRAKRILKKVVASIDTKKNGFYLRKGTTDLLLEYYFKLKNAEQKDQLLRDMRDRKKKCQKFNLQFEKKLAKMREKTARLNQELKENSI